MRRSLLRVRPRRGGGLRIAALAISLGVLACVQTGCEPARTGASQGGPQRPLPAIEQVIAAHNARVARLTRLWGSGVVSIRYTDERGRERYEQGEANLQIVQPSRLALSVRKVGETLLWIGCDETRYWLIEPREARRAYLGLHEAITPDKVGRLGVPAAPRDLIRLSGLVPIEGGPGLALTWDQDAPLLRLDEPGEAGSTWRSRLDPARLVPVRIELVGPDGQIWISAGLEEYKPVNLAGVGGFFPEAPSRIRLRDERAGSTLLLTLDIMNDGTKRLRESNFDLDVLLSALGVSERVDLDAAPADAVTP